MTDSLNPDHDAMIDRLVDGELSDVERRTLLESLDSAPGSWRRCALAFLEAQAWRDGFLDVLQKSTPLRPAAEIPKRSKPTPISLDTRNDRRSVRRFMNWAGMAASVLFAFTLGVIEHDHFVASPNVQPVSPQQLADAATPDAQDPASGRDRDSLTLWVRDESGNRRSLRVPLMDAVALDRELGVEFRSGLPLHVREQLRNGGYDVHSRQRYAPLWLDNGQRMVLPVEDTRIVPVSENVY